MCLSRSKWFGAVAVFVLAPALFAQPDRASEQIPLKNWPVAYETISRGEMVLQPETPTPPSAHFVAVTPCRIVDTRNANGPFGGPAFSAGTTRMFTIPSGPCVGIPAAAAYSLNFTIVGYDVSAGANGFLTAFPDGLPRPTVSTVNFGNGAAAIANAAVVPASGTGTIDVFASAATHLIIDINGYFATGVVTNLTAGAGMTGGGTGAVVLGLNTTGSTAGHVLTSTGSGVAWQPATLSLPYYGTFTTGGNAFAISNPNGIGINGSSTTSVGIFAHSTSGSGLYASSSASAIVANGGGSDYPVAVLGCHSINYTGGFGFLSGGGSGHATNFSNRCFSMFVANGIWSAGGEIDQASDRRAKEDIAAISDADALRFLEGAKPVRFKWRNRNEYNYGFIAQDIDKLGFREAVVAVPNPEMKKTVDPDGYVSAEGAELGLGYQQFTSILTKASQVLHEKIKALEQENAALRAYLCGKDPAAEFCGSSRPAK